MNPIWSRDGRELFYRNGDGLFVVKVDSEPTITIASPTAMFSGRYRLSGRDFDVSRDRTRFVMMRPNAARTTTTVHVLRNWWRVLDARLKGTQ